MKYMAAKKDDKKLLDRAVVLGSSLVYLGKGVADDIISELEKNKILAGDEGKDMAKKIRSQAMDKGDEVRKTVITELGKVINELNSAAKKAEKKGKTAKK